MKLTIDINDDELNSALAQGIKNLSDETITELAKDAISSYLQTDAGIESVIYRNKRSAWDTPELRPEILKLLENSFSNEEIESYRSKIFQALDSKGGSLMVEILANVFSRMLLTEATRQDIAEAIARSVGR